MKVCLITTSFPAFKDDTKGIFIFHLAKELSKKIDVSVITPFFKKSKNNLELLGRVKVYRAQYFFPRSMQTVAEKSNILFEVKKSLISMIQIPFLVLSMIMNGLKLSKNYDIIHAQWLFSGFVGALIKKLNRKKLILTIRGSDLNRIKNMRLIRFVLNNCNFIVSNNKKQYNKLKDLGYKNIALVYNGIDTELFKPMNKKLCVKKSNLPIKKRIFIYIGWLDKHKGINYLYDAIKLANKKRNDLFFLFIGDGSLREYLINKAKEDGISNIQIISKVPHHEIPYYINSSEALILPSEAEGMPNVVLESMSCGIPVISTDVGDVKEFIAHDQNGLIIKKDPQDIADKISYLLEKNKSSKFGKLARITIIKKGLSWEKSANNYINIYKRLI
ncbi:MAG: glycosyltransferase [Nanoarchaeota archaeon]